MDKIYLVCGQYGEYSDRREWTVAAYASEMLAREHVEQAGAYLREMRARHEFFGWDLSYQEAEKLKTENPFDHNGEYSIGSSYETDYWVEEVAVRNSVPKWGNNEN